MTTPPRRFTNEFRVDQFVRVIRTEHGWYNGSLLAQITHLEDFGCTVVDEEGIAHFISKPRDIRATDEKFKDKNPKGKKGKKR